MKHEKIISTVAFGFLHTRCRGVFSLIVLSLAAWGSYSLTWHSISSVACSLRQIKCRGLL